MQYKKVIALSALALLPITSSYAVDLNDTQTALIDTMVMGANDKCTCPDDSSGQTTFEKCMDKNEKKILKAGTDFGKFLGIKKGPFKNAFADAMEESVAECEASWDGGEEPPPDEEDPDM